MNHPCNHYSCMENYHGECYGEGCCLNPMPTSELSTHYLYDDDVPFAEDGEDENENTQEDT